MRIKKLFKTISIALGGIIALFILFVFLANTFGVGGKLLIPVKHKQIFVNDNISEFPSILTVKENKIINSKGNTVILKGLMAPTPEKNNLKNNFNEAYYKKIFEAGGNVIRVPVAPESWETDKDYLWRYLDPLVSWAGENNNYMIIDLHFIGNISTGAGSEMPKIKENPKALTLNFWKQTASYFKGAPNVIFEIYNEPNQITYEDWHKNAQEIVSAIRETGADQLILVGGIDYSYDLSWVESSPIKDNNVAYATHVYPSRNDWDYHFGEISKKHPVIVTEWGFMDENGNNAKQPYLIGDEDTYGKPLLKYLSEKDIGWIACWYDDEWEPPLFTKDFKDKTRYGKFVFSKLK